MRSIKWLVITISFFALFTIMFNNLALAEGNGGDGGGDGGDSDDYDESDHHDNDGHHHHDHNHFILGIGGYYDPWFWGGYYGRGIGSGYYGPGLWSPYGYRSYGYSYADPFFRPYYMYPPAVAVPSQPPVYIQQQQPKRTQSKISYWYYCQNPQGYYPYIKECPKGWLQVVPQPYAQ